MLRLYAILQPEDPVSDARDERVADQWREILRDDRLRYFVAEADGVVVATCTLTLVPNLTRGMKPYGLIENVVTDPAFRRRGFGRAVLLAALQDAWSAGCYKVMLLSGRKEEGTLSFYEGVGFMRGLKTGFVAYPS